MILELYIFLIVINTFFVALGYFLKGKADILRFTGFVGIFILGLMLIPYTPFGSVEIQTGSVINATTDVYAVDYSYIEYDNFQFGFYLAVLGGLGFASTFASRQEVDDYE